MTGEYDGVIPGLFLNDCSCLQCRTARKADPGYQAHLHEKWAKETVRRRKNTIEQSKGHAKAMPHMFADSAEKLMKIISLSRLK